MTKICICCGNEKDIKDFYKHKLYPDGYEKKCKKCRNTESKENYKENKNRLKSVRAKWYQENKDWYLEHCKGYQQKLENKERKKIISNIRDKKRRKTDIDFKLRKNLRTGIWHAIKGHYKSEKSMDLIGCSIEELKIYLERKFWPKMTWENWGNGEGKWNIDHILPCASFDLSDQEQQRKCFHYTNLQPLWWKDNMDKGDKLDFFIPFPNSN